jgi:heterotetrameric sarcosine oxidase gamma subunit
VTDLPIRAEVVVVGGGVIGTSIAYHLARLGRTDVVVLEQHTLTAGTTWHAAGLITSAGFTDETALWLSNYSRELYQRLEAETGQATGFRAIGHLHIATNAARLETMRREAAFQRSFGIDAEEVSAAEVAGMWPIALVDDVVGAIYRVQDGRANPVDVTMSLARGARDAGVRIVQGVEVTGFTITDGRCEGVVTTEGAIEAEQVVLAAGMWTRQLAALAGALVPLQAAEHYYLLTEPFDGADPELPVMEDPDRYSYYREEGQGLLVGLFEPEAAAWKPDGVPREAAFTELEPDWDRLAPFVAASLDRVPALQTVGIKKLFCGPESFTTNLHPHLGETPEVRGLWVAAGLNSLGILQGGGVGSLLAQWMTDGVAPLDVTHYHVDRALTYEATRAYRIDRTVEQLGNLFGDAAFPTWKPRTARGIRRSVLHDRLAAAGAQFSESMGWEAAMWFAEPGPRAEAPAVAPSWARGPAYAAAAVEHRAVREAVGVFDMSLMAKFLVQGPDSCAVLDDLSVSDIDVRSGRIVYTQWCNESGGVEADLTVTRLDAGRFLVVASDVIQRRTETMIRRAIAGQDAHASVTDITGGVALLSLQGPRSRELLRRVSPDDFGNDAFPYLDAQQIEIAYAPVLAIRVTYVGELGWELHIPAEFASGVFDRLVDEGRELGLRLCGFNALESLRLEKGYRDYAHDLDNTDTPLEAGLGFTVGWDKKFVGRDALAAQRDQGTLTRRHVLAALEDPGPLLYGGEPVYRDGVGIGYLRVGAYGHTLGCSVGLGSVECADGVTREWLESGTVDIDVAGRRVRARLSLSPLYDPSRSRILA